MPLAGMIATLDGQGGFSQPFLARVFRAERVSKLVAILVLHSDLKPYAQSKFGRSELATRPTPR